ncbi:MAG: hypothetical protein ACK5B9_05215 [Flavobacteriia bacterium]|jgi:hypothetical protein
MKRKLKDLVYTKPWYEEFESPFSKWLANLSILGFYFGTTFGIIWFILFNPMVTILYFVIIFIYILL